MENEEISDLREAVMKDDSYLKLKLVLQELEDNPYRKFRIAFSLMSIIPFLVFLYLLVGKLFTFRILISDIGVVLFISFLLALCGSSIGYGIIKKILDRIIFYAIQLKQSDKLKSTFVATVSHELKNPIAAIKMHLYNILEGLLGALSEEQKKTIQLCYDVIDRMNRLISGLLDVYKIEAGMVELKRKLCNLEEILERQIREFDALLNRKRIKLTKEVITKGLLVWADEDRLTQVVSNLLSNAIKYTPDDGAVTLKVYTVNGFVKLECIDNGPGIPPDKIDRIFNKFQRLDFTKEGTGLGLAISKDIVELHKGRIWAESQPDGGSKFIVVLPRDLRKEQIR